MFGVKLSKVAEKLFNDTRIKYKNIAKFTRFNARIKGTDDSAIMIFEFMHKLNEKYNLDLTISLHQKDVIFLR